MITKLPKSLLFLLLFGCFGYAIGGDESTEQDASEDVQILSQTFNTSRSNPINPSVGPALTMAADYALGLKAIFG